jgi:hypothetical protein
MGPSPRNGIPPPDSPSFEPRFTVWLLVGLTLVTVGVAALYQMYTATPVGGVGWLPLSLALLAAASGGYAVLAAVLHLWLPKPRATPIKNQRLVSVVISVCLTVVATGIGLNFPRKHSENAPSKGGDIPILQPTASSGLQPHHSHRMTPKPLISAQPIAHSASSSLRIPSQSLSPSQTPTSFAVAFSEPFFTAVPNTTESGHRNNLLELKYRVENSEHEDISIKICIDHATVATSANINEPARIRDTYEREHPKRSCTTSFTPAGSKWEADIFFDDIESSGLEELRTEAKRFYYYGEIFMSRTRSRSTSQPVPICGYASGDGKITECSREEART